MRNLFQKDIVHVFLLESIVDIATIILIDHLLSDFE